MRFVIATNDYAGLGFAVRIQEEGHDVLLATNPDPEDASDAYERVGRGLVPKVPLSELIPKRADMRDWYWVWDFNHSVEENELLRREGFKVLGGGEHAWRMEHDRQACVDFVGTYGLHSPPSFPFDDRAAAIEFCRQNRRTAYVYKPDHGESFETFIPESEDPLDANHELQVHLGSLGANKGSRVGGIRPLRGSTRRQALAAGSRAGFKQLRWRQRAAIPLQVNPHRCSAQRPNGYFCALGAVAFVLAF